MNIPVNKLEKQKDNKRIWRQKVNSELKKNYNKIFNLIDKLIFLKVPSFKYVFKWRSLQEKKLRITGKGNKTMNNKQIENFFGIYNDPYKLIYFLQISSLQITFYRSRSLPYFVFLTEKERLK